MPTTPPIPSLLGLRRADFRTPPLITTETTLWGLYCVAPDESQPRLVSWWKSEANAQRHLSWLLTSAWTCHRCRERYARHATVEAGAGLDACARQLAQGGHADPVPPEELETRTPSPPKRRMRGIEPNGLGVAPAPADPEESRPRPPANARRPRAPQVSQDPFEEGASWKMSR